jgi:hypothetical protein
MIVLLLLSLVTEITRFAVLLTAHVCSLSSMLAEEVEQLEASFEQCEAEYEGCYESVQRVVAAWTAQAGAFRAKLGADSSSSGDAEQERATSGKAAVDALPKGSAAAGDGGRAAYRSAEQALQIAFEQIAAAESVLTRMAAAVDTSRAACATAAAAAQQSAALDRGPFGCCLSPEDTVHSMSTKLSMYQQEWSTVKLIAGSLAYDLPEQTLTCYSLALELRPHLDDTVLARLREAEQLSLILRAEQQAAG